MVRPGMPNATLRLRHPLRAACWTPLLLAALVATMAGGIARAGETKVAVAANFTDAAKEIGTLFEQKTGHKAVFSFGASGQLYTQISQGAPFEIFLSADRATVTKAAAAGLGDGATQFTYAVGKLVLYGKGKDSVTGERTLGDGKFGKLAMANPAAAPYGAAAIEVLKALGVHDALSAKIVQGQNITQTYQFVDTGNAEIGFVALSQVIGKAGGSQWVVPDNLYTPIRQDAILLAAGTANEAARAFVAFLKGPEAARVKEKYGYGTGDR